MCDFNSTFIDGYISLAWKANLKVQLIQREMEKELQVVRNDRSPRREFSF
jgi:hypothetical protein